MEWAEETILRLRQLWDEGHSTVEIGRRMGISKNAVVGKVHRLDLPGRPSPIRRDGSGGAPRRSAPRRVHGPTLPPLSSTEPLPPLPTGNVRGTTVCGAGISAQRARAMQAAVTNSGGEPFIDVDDRRITMDGAVSTPVKQVPDSTPRVAVPGSRPHGRVITCCWPIGEPGTRNFRFCDAESLPRKPYCDQHAQLAYTKPRDRREEDTNADLGKHGIAA